MSSCVLFTVPGFHCALSAHCAGPLVKPTLAEKGVLCKVLGILRTIIIKALRILLRA